MKKFIGGVLFLTVTSFAVAQTGTEKINLSSKKDSSLAIISDDPLLLYIDSIFADEFFKAYGFADETEVPTPFKEDVIPSFDKATYKKRMALLDSKTPMTLTYNDYVHAFIHLYADKRRKLTARELGLSKIYFPIFEEYLDKYQMPLELKYLSIIESALNPRAISHAGAAGLWQFMYRTGKMYDLDVNSYYDERMNVHKSTDAACQYLKMLYGLYGDWDLALASYNCGPGNVNKAIRRAGGGKKTFWEIYDYLPRETRGYVPAFIAVNYVMNYHKEHNIYPINPKLPYTKTDTVFVKKMVSFYQISESLDIPISTLELLNPEYKKNVIPAHEKPLTLRLPYDKVGLFVSNEDAIYALRSEQEVKDSIAAAQEIKIPGYSGASSDGSYFIHVVKSGQYLGMIAEKYNVRVNQIRDWNNLRGTNIYIGQKLKIYANKPTSTSTTTTKKPTVVAGTSGSSVYHTVVSGDNLWAIANKYGVTIESIKTLNPSLNGNSLQVGMKLKVK